MDILLGLRIDHRRLLDLVERLEAAALDRSRPSRADACAPLLADLLSRLERHEALERRLLLPELGRRAPELGPRLQELEQDHEGLHELLRGFERSLSGPSQRVDEVMRLGNCLRSHILQEDADVLALAQDRIPPEVRARLGEEAACP